MITKWLVCLSFFFAGLALCRRLRWSWARGLGVAAALAVAVFFSWDAVFPPPGKAFMASQSAAGEAMGGYLANRFDGGRVWLLLPPRVETLEAREPGGKRGDPLLDGMIRALTNCVAHLEVAYLPLSPSVQARIDALLARPDDMTALNEASWLMLQGDNFDTGPIASFLKSLVGKADGVAILGGSSVAMIEARRLPGRGQAPEVVLVTGEVDDPDYALAHTCLGTLVSMKQRTFAGRPERPPRRPEEALNYYFMIRTVGAPDGGIAP